jgi:uncharacterized protein (TIGR02246 family)
MSPNDEQAIFDETAAFAETWNRGDAQAAAAFYTEDGTRVGAFGDVQHGRAAIGAAIIVGWVADTHLKNDDNEGGKTVTNTLVFAMTDLAAIIAAERGLVVE